MPSPTRPLSPHLQVYKPQITSFLSILHRLTGVALAGGLLIFAWALGAAAYGPDSYETVRAILGSWFGRLVLFGWSAALFFHLCNGIRHLFWDFGYGFANDQVTKSGYAVLAGTAFLTLAAWAAALAG
ncbi:MAG: succinate dehydrogenase, cytochrome b556 subunit [Alphaproteobacteria bacterium]|nr:succinate dehydrogenase, cytochrome b556 subunit [Alphaproteobacteria bacterium]